MMKLALACHGCPRCCAGSSKIYMVVLLLCKGWDSGGPAMLYCSGVLPVSAAGWRLEGQGTQDEQEMSMTGAVNLVGYLKRVSRDK